MVVVCLLSYLAAFLVLERRGKWPQENAEHAKEPAGQAHASGRGVFALFAFLRGNCRKPDFWLAVFVSWVLLRYAVAYESASKSLQVVVLLTGVVFGKAVAFWTQGSRTLSASPPDGARGAGVRVRGFLTLLLLLLAVSVLCQTDSGMQYQYRGIPRWKGPWDNPNTFGVLVAVGAVLGVGMLMSAARKAESGKQKADIQRWVRMVLLIAPTVVCGIGLLKSYSRGAWLGAVCGLGFIVYQVVRWQVAGAAKTESRKQKVEISCGSPSRLGWLSVAVVGLSVFTIAFWQFRHSQSPLLRRVFSVANLNDFSWRNRVTVWQGSVRMLRAHPWFGVGWGQVEKEFAEGYRAARLEESAAVQLNDYFTLANSAGLPALLCFLAFVGLSFTRSPECRVRNQEKAPHPGPLPSAERGSVLVSPTSATLDFGPETPALAPACCAAALVLLIGFWFDGGLFKLAASAVFWLLLGLANVIPGQAFGSSESVSGPIVSQGGCGSGSLPRGGVALRWLAVLLAMLALGQTALHLIPPQLDITPRTLEIARRYLIAPKEAADFACLSTKPYWPGKKLKTLLEHVELANYNRELINWKLEDELYRNFVLSPEIAPEFDGTMHWRRLLWEHFYPRIRKEESPAPAVQTILTYLRSRVGIIGKPLAPALSPPRGERNAPNVVEQIWIRQITNKKGFEVICVAALRSAGIPARLNSQNRAEFWNGAEWKPVSPPSLGEPSVQPVSITRRD